MSSNQKQPGDTVRPVVLAFHKLSPKFSFGVTNYSPERFEKLLSYLSTNSYRFISIDEFPNAGDKDVLITFDDGYAHLLEYLPQFIETYRIKPLIFIPTKFIGQPNSWDYSHLFVKEPHLDIDEIKELSDLGVDFGSHGHSHTDLRILSDVLLAEELAKSKKILEDVISKKVDAISYPFGRINKHVLEYTHFSEYKYGFTMSFPDSFDSLLSLGRIPVYGYDSLFSIIQKIECGAFYKVEKLKATLTNKLSGGTILLNRLRK